MEARVLSRRYSRSPLMMPIKNVANHSRLITGLIRDQMGDGGTLSLFLRHIVDPTKEMATEDSSKGSSIAKHYALHIR